MLPESFPRNVRNNLFRAGDYYTPRVVRKPRGFLRADASILVRCLISRGNNNTA